MILISKRENVPKRKAPQGLSYFVREFQLAKVVQHITQQKQTKKQNKRGHTTDSTLAVREIQSATQRHTGRISLRLKAHGVIQKQNSRGTKTATHQRD